MAIIHVHPPGRTGDSDISFSTWCGNLPIRVDSWGERVVDRWI